MAIPTDAARRSWRLTIREQRYRLDRHLHHNPSLKSQLAEALEEAYALAVIRGERETALDGASFPPDCPFTFDEAMTPGLLAGVNPRVCRPMPPRATITARRTAQPWIFAPTISSISATAANPCWRGCINRSVRARSRRCWKCMAAPGPEATGSTTSSIAEALAADGIVVMSIDFRMPPVAGYPDTIADVNFGIRWLKANAEKFHSRADLVGGLGSSSGGHMLLLSALRPNDPRYAKLPLPGSAVDASLRFAIGCWPVADPLAALSGKEGGRTGTVRHLARQILALGSCHGRRQSDPDPEPRRGGREAADADHARHRRRQSDARHGGQFRRRLRQGRRLRSRKEIFPGQPHAFISGRPTAANSLRALEMIKTFVHKHAG